MENINDNGMSCGTADVADFGTKLPILIDDCYLVDR